MSDEAVIIVPLGTELFAFTEREIAAARTRAVELGLTPQRENTVERLVDAAQLHEITNLPQSWLEEAARQNRIPSIVAGKYRRYQPSAVIVALTDQGANENGHQYCEQNGRAGSHSRRK